MHGEPYLAVEDVARRLGVHHDTVVRMIRDGRLPGAVRIGKAYRIPQSALLSLLGKVPVPAPRAEIVVVANQKGGVGKTTTAVALASALARLGRRTLLIDLDPQAGCALMLRTGLTGDDGQPLPLERTIYAVLLDRATWEEVTLPSPVGCDLVPATIDLAAADVELNQQMLKETLLERKLCELPPHYQYVVLDTPPNLGILTVNALSAAHRLLVPVACDFMALRGLDLLLQTIAKVRRVTNPRLELFGILPTFYDQRTGTNRRMLEQLTAYAEAEGLRLFPPVPRTTRVAEAPEFGTSVVLSQPASIAAQHYLKIAEELIHASEAPAAAAVRVPQQRDRRSAAREGGD
jgi:chromosome partitioning protein